MINFQDKVGKGTGILNTTEVGLEILQDWGH